MSVEETGSLELFEGKQQEITRQELVERVSEHVNRILRRNLYELKLDERQTFRLLRQKEELRRYLKEAGTGNLQVKEYLISFIQEFLLNGMKMDEEMIKHTFFFSEKGSRQAAVRFDILLFLANNPEYRTASDIVEFRKINGKTDRGTRLIVRNGKCDHGGAD